MSESNAGSPSPSDSRRASSPAAGKSPLESGRGSVDSRPDNAQRTANRWLPSWFWGVSGVIAVLIVITRLPPDWLPPIMEDTAIPNMLNVALVVLLFLMWSVWLALFSGQRAQVRFLPILGFVLLAVVAGLTIRIDEVWGGLVPSKVSWRWQPPADFALATLQPQAVQEGPTIDVSTVTADDFSGFLGAERTNSAAGVELDTDWQTSPPQELWRHEIGSGWSGFSAVGGYAFTLEQRGLEESVSCYRVETGELVWATSETTRHETVMGGAGPRSTPLIHQGRVYAVGATGILRCLDGATGKVVWRKELRRDYGIEDKVDDANIAWGRAGSPLAVDDLIVVPVGGAGPENFVSLAAYRADTGERVWTGGKHQISYASPSLVTLGGARQILVVLESVVAGFDPQSGQQLWEHPWPGSSHANANVSQAWAADGQHVFVSKGYGQGCTLFSVTPSDGGGEKTWETAEVWANSSAMKTKFSNPTLFAGHAYGLDDGVLSCVELKSGERSWKKGRFGHGQVLLVGDKLLVLAEEGTLHLIEATPEKFVELGELSVLNGKTWNNLCLTRGVLLVRNGEQAAAYRLPVKSTAD